MKKQKLIILFSVFAVICAASAILVFAEDNNPAAVSGENAVSVKPIITDVRDSDLRQDLSIKENKGAIYRCKELGDRCPDFGNGKSSIEVVIKAGKVTEIGTDLIKVSIFGQTFSVKLAGTTKIVRYFWGSSSIDELSVGDIVNVWGYMDASDYATINAKTVRDVSIQSKHGVFKGTVESVGVDSFIVKTEDKGNQTVLVSADTKIMKPAIGIVCAQSLNVVCPKEIAGTLADIKSGSVVVVRGVWNKTLSQIKAVSVVIGGVDDTRPFFKKLKSVIQENIKKQATSTGAVVQ